ncbi:MAG: hypothetical protein ABI883_01240 [Chthoniobacterales bacterium]
MSLSCCKHLLRALIILALPGSLRAAAMEADATARLLAGLREESSAFADPSLESVWTEHARQFDSAWAQLEQRQLEPIRAWAPQFLGDAYENDAPMFYMFSGPDFLYANAFYPDARTYILCGIEPVGAVPDIASIPPALLPSALANLRKSLDSVLSWSFFITKNMKSDLNQTQLNGTLPVLYVFLARAGYTIENVELVALDRAGDFTAMAKGATPGVKIEFNATGGPRQTLFYFSSDLSDGGVEANPGFLRFCETRGRGAALLKAASYLMHGRNFNRVRDFLLTHSRIILQDDSGIPYRYFQPAQWTLRQCGRYVGPIALFKQYPQPDLARAFNISAPAPLAFGFGYQWQANRTSLVIARPKEALALPPEEEPEELSVGEGAAGAVPDDD